MKVYIVTQYIPYEDCEIVGVYKDADVAEAERARLTLDDARSTYVYYLEEWEVL